MNHHITDPDPIPYGNPKEDKRKLDRFDAIGPNPTWKQSLVYEIKERFRNLINR